LDENISCTAILFLQAYMFRFKHSSYSKMFTLLLPALVE